MSKTKKLNSLKSIEKVPTGIKGFDEITYGGIPKGRPTLICGNAGSGKTLMALEIIIRGIIEFNEPGVFLTFEERKEDIIKNVASMGFDLADLEKRNLLTIQYIHVDSRGYTETGEYDLEGLFIRIECAVKKIKAKRLAIDTIELLFSSFTNEIVLRSELRRLFGWLKDRELTTILTGEEGSGNALTRYGIEEYVADCVVSLSNNLIDDLYTRRLQVVKYRGCYHETNRFPFIISQNGISLLPLTSLDMEFEAPLNQISTGVAGLDACLDGKGYYEGSSILLSGSSGSGKTTFAGAFAKSVVDKKQKCLFISYEESAKEVLRNLNSVGMDLNPNIKNGLLKIVSTRPTQWGLEKHLGNFIQDVEEFNPKAVIIDPLSTLIHCGTEIQVYSVLTRMIDYLKKKNITFLMTMFSSHDNPQEFSYGISSIIDTWIKIRNNEIHGELNRDLVIIKSRGMGHSNQVREFTISSHGIVINDPYYSERGVLTGTARIVQESQDAITKAHEFKKLEKLQYEIELKKRLIELQIQSLNAELDYKASEATDEVNFYKFKKEVSDSAKEALKDNRFINHKKSGKGDHVKKRK